MVNASLVPFSAGSSWKCHSSLFNEPFVCLHTISLSEIFSTILSKQNFGPPTIFKSAFMEKTLPSFRTSCVHEESTTTGAQSLILFASSRILERVEGG